jgi:drug/metabolite transporter (DMT)-like permease
MAVSRTQIAIIAAFAAIYVIWGSTYLALALALQSLPPFLLMAVRCLVGGAVLYGYARLTGADPPTAKPCMAAVACGMLFFVGGHGVLAYAQQHVPTGVAAVLLATIPLWITLLQAVLPGGERPTLKRLAFLAPGLAGVALIAWREAAIGASALHLVDLLLLLGASASWALGTVISERQSGSAPPAILSGLELLAGGVVLTAVGIARGELSTFDIEQLSMTSAVGWAYLTIAGTIIAFASYIWLLQRVSPPVVATYTFVNPIIAVLLGWAFLGEKPTLWMIGGAVLVIASVAGLLLSGHGQPAHRPAGQGPAVTGSGSAGSPANSRRQQGHSSPRPLRS